MLYIISVIICLLSVFNTLVAIDYLERNEIKLSDLLFEEREEKSGE